jgi:mono/diheme cytochrome c family protein
MRAPGIISLILFASLAACENYDLDLHDQITFKTQESPRYRRPVRSVTVQPARTDYSKVDGVTLKNPFAKNEQTIARGQKLFNIYCIACHAADGSTKGAPVADKLDPRPADLRNEAVSSLTEGEIFHRIVQGFGIMPSYKRDLSDEEAWYVTEYVTVKLQNRD